MTTQVEQLRAQIETILAPAKQAYEQIGSDIGAKQDELVALRHEQAEIRKMIRAIEPEFEKQERVSSNGKPKKKTRSGAEKYSAARIAEVHDWLQQNAEEFNQGDGFYASDLVNRKGCPINYQSGLSAIFTALHQQGLLRLTKASGRGGRKVFKVLV